MGGEGLSEFHQNRSRAAFSTFALLTVGWILLGHGAALCMQAV